MIAHIQLGVFISGARVFLPHVHPQDRAHYPYNTSRTTQIKVVMTMGEISLACSKYRSITYMLERLTMYSFILLIATLSSFIFLI